MLHCTFAIKSCGQVVHFSVIALFGIIKHYIYIIIAGMLHLSEASAWPRG